MKMRALILLAATFTIGFPATGQPSREEARQPRLERPWWSAAPVIRSQYYRIKSDLPEADLSRLANHLDRTFDGYVHRLGSLRQNLPTSFDVMIFADRDDYMTTLSVQYGINAQGTGGMFFSSPNGSALAFYTGGLNARRVEHVLQHEGFHQVAFALFGGNLPPWVNEGLAEFFGEGIMVGRKLVIGQSNPRVIQNIRDAIETNAHIPFRQMLTMDGLAWNENVKGGNARLQYEQAWSMIHFLVYGENGRHDGEFFDYLRYLNTGFDSYTSFVRAFGSDDIEQFEADWKAHAMAQTPSAFLTAMERIEFLSAGLLRLSESRVYPATIEELRNELRTIDFVYTLESHSVKTELRATQDELFEIPQDDLVRDGETARFVLEKTTVRPRNSVQRRWEHEYPTPPTVRSEGLRPNNVAVSWARDDETGDFGFEIEVR